METSAGQILVRLEGKIVQQASIPMGIVTIGRLPENDLVLPNPLVSRRHAELRWGAAGLALTDLGSTHGTTIAGVRLLPNQPHLVPAGATFQIGPFTLTYEPHSLPVDALSSAAAEAAVARKAEEASGLFGEVEFAPPSALPVPVSGNGHSRSWEEVSRPTLPPPRANGSESRYLFDLPAPYQDNEFLGRFLLVFESLWEPLEQRQNAIHMYFDPRTCPISFLPWLAGWMDLSFNQHWPEFRRRQLLSEATSLYRWRGTHYGLTRMIELCTGVTPEIDEPPDQPFTFRVRVKTSSNNGIDRSFIEDIIQAHKPAHAGYILEVT